MKMKYTSTSTYCTCTCTSREHDNMKTFFSSLAFWEGNSPVTDWLPSRRTSIVERRCYILWTHKRQPIHRPYGQAMGRLFWVRSLNNHCKVWDAITNPFPNFNGSYVWLLEWTNNFTLHFTKHLITYPRWDSREFVLIKRDPGCNNFQWTTPSHLNTV